MQAILKNAAKAQLFLNSMALHPDSLPLCFSSIGMYEDFLIAITQFNSEYHDALNEAFCYLFQIQITRLMSNSNE
jgi:hypothetical protein